MCTKSAFTNRTSTDRERETNSKKYGFDMCASVCLHLATSRKFNCFSYLILDYDCYCYCYSYCPLSAIDNVLIRLEGVFCVSVRAVHPLLSIRSGQNANAHMYLSRLFILFHFNIAIDVIAVVKICLLVSFSPLWICNSCATDVMSKCPRRKSDVTKVSLFCCIRNSTSAFRNYDYNAQMRKAMVMVAMLAAIHWERFNVNWYKSGIFVFNIRTQSTEKNYAKIHFKSPEYVIQIKLDTERMAAACNEWAFWFPTILCKEHEKCAQQANE